MDDATGAIYSAFLVEEEGTASTFRALNEVFAEHGLPMSLYTDRGSHYFRTTKAGEIDRGSPTQVGRALEQLGVEHIGAFSPQARGRSERAFQTLQDRLVKELTLAGVTCKRGFASAHRNTYNTWLCFAQTIAQPSWDCKLRAHRSIPTREFELARSRASLGCLTKLCLSI